MQKLFDEPNRAISCLDHMPVEELLLLIGDEERGFKSTAIDVLLAMEYDSVFPILEQSIRNDNHADLRNSAMEVMTRFGRQAVPNLLVLLKDYNEEVRNFSAIMLGEIGSREAVGPLIQALSDEDVNVRHGSAEALGKIGDRTALVPLLDLLKEDFWQQFPAVTAIAAMRDNRAVPHLVKLLGDNMLEGAIIDALGEIGDPRALKYLFKILEDSDRAITGKIIQATVKIYRNIEDDCRYKNNLTTCHEAVLKNCICNRKCIEKIKCLINPGENPTTVKAAIILLGWLGDPTVLPEFFYLLENEDYLESVEGAIIAMGKNSVPLLMQALQHPSENVRIVAVRSLRWMGEGIDLEIIIPLLFDRCERVCLEVLESLKGSASPEALTRLFELLEDSDPEVRTLSAQVLGCYPYAQLQGFLERMISSPAAFKRKCAAALIGSMSCTVSPNVIGFLIKDADPEVRTEAVKSAGWLKSMAMMTYLVDALSDADLGVRKKQSGPLPGSEKMRLF